MLSSRLQRAKPGLLAQSRSSPEMFGEFFEATQQGILGFFLLETENEQVAVDLWAETFATAFEERYKFRGSSDQQARSWLRSIAQHKLMHYLRDQSYELAAVNRLGWERPYVTDDELRAIELMGAEEAIQGHLDSAVGRLPDDQQQVIRLRYWGKLTYPEIGRRLGVSTDTARTRGFRGLRTLRSGHHAREIEVLRQA